MSNFKKKFNLCDGFNSVQSFHTHSQLANMFVDIFFILFLKVRYKTGFQEIQFNIYFIL